MEDELNTTDKELIDALVDMGYSLEVAKKMAKSRKHMAGQLAVEDNKESSIVTKINNFLKVNDE
jgi:hypothetical protein